MPEPEKLRVLCVHGVGRHPVGGPWEDAWRAAIEQGLAGVGVTRPLALGFVHYDDLFEKYPLSFLGTLEAVAKLVGSGIAAPFRARGLARGSLGSGVKWSAGMVVKWVEDARFRRDTRARLVERLRRFASDDPQPPDLVLAHSLGSLVLYDTLTATLGLALPRTRVVTLGSQIGNAFVTGQFLAGRVRPLENVEHWYHLYNPEDDVFTARLCIAHARFEEVETFFDESGMADHSAERYLAHPAAANHVWSDLALAAPAVRGLGRPSGRPPKRPALALRERARVPRRRALLVGINDYPDPADRLEGCVNDVFLTSSLLQESGFEAEDIRVVLDRRATAHAIRERLEWLLEGIDEDSVERGRAEGAPVERVLYYSGHGAQLPTYGAGDRVDERDETLVPWDFDWSAERSLTDDWLHRLYAGLPYELRFLALFDCCHSGGLTRDGGPRVRGLSPPDDVRHRALRWDAEREMWAERELVSRDPKFQEWAQRGLGAKPARLAPTAMTARIGHAMALRGLSEGAFERRRKELRHHGPYMPLLLYACREDEVALEYRHGAVSHGAFTYALVKHVRARRRAWAGTRGKRRTGAPTFEALVRSVGDDLAALGYDQHPEIAGPMAARKDHVPFLKRASTRRRRR
jgi:hypothetical protein